MSQKRYFNEIKIGTCYYPEHWDEKLWTEDLQRMLAVGIKTVRVAEFAWTIFEPSEGRYSFDFFDRFLNVALENQMKVIFCTPTATPPAWLTQKYPEVLNCDIDGHPYEHGCRRHYNYNSPKYQELSAKITEQLAKHYRQHPAIVGWQIDNEINCELDVFYSESDDIAFREYVRDKYGSLDELNRAWGTVFWNQTYTEWQQVHIPRRVVHDSVNPHRVLDYIRFISESACRFVNMQSEILRQYIRPEVYITTNGMFGHMNNHKMTKDSLDIYMYDSYPNMANMLSVPSVTDDLKDRKWSRHLARVRSISPIFGIMEQQSGAGGWNTRMEAPSPKPGQITLWAMQSIAHGADYVSFFRWRTSIMGTEIYWHGILDYSGRDNWRLAEIGDIYKKTQTIGAVAGGIYQAKFAVLEDYDNLFDSDVDCWHRRIMKASEKGIFNAAQKTHTPMDYIYFYEGMTAEALLCYPIVFYPHGVILTDEISALLTDYVAAGGILVLGCRTGYKDITGKCVMDKLPGKLQTLSGADVVDYTLIGNGEYPKVLWQGKEMPASIFNDVLEPLDDAVVEGVYEGNYYAGEAGLIRRSYGKGQVYYFGGVFDETAATIFLENLDIANPHGDVLELPECCELAVRENEQGKFFFVLNYSADAVQVKIKKKMTDLYTGEIIEGDVDLKAYGTMVLK